MRKLGLLLIFIILSLAGYSNDTIVAQSRGIKFKVKPKSPPDLNLNLEYDDENNDQILVSRENSKLTLRIQNKGKGIALGIKVKVELETRNPSINIYNNDIDKFDLRPGEGKVLTVEINAKKDTKTQEHKFKITVDEHYGHGIETSYLIVYTAELAKPQLVFSGMEVIDKGEGTSAIFEDGRLQAGERVHVKIGIKNMGQDISTNTLFEIISEDTDINLEHNKIKAGTLESDSSKEFSVYINPNKNVYTTDKLPLYLNVLNDEGFGEIKRFQLPLYLDKMSQKEVSFDVSTMSEELKRSIAKFEFESPKITVTKSDFLNINYVPSSTTYRPNSIGIIIGMEQYDYLTQTTKYAHFDAFLVENYFKNILGVEKLSVFSNKQVSGLFFDNQFNRDFGELKKNVIKGKSDIFVYYSGLLFPSKDREKILLLPSDVNQNLIEKQGFDINELFSSLQSLEARSVTVIFDACYPNAVKSTDNNFSKGSNEIPREEIKAEITQEVKYDTTFSIFRSSDFTQTSFRYDKSKTGLFTYYFCAGLQGKADTNKDKKITNEELEEYILRNVKKIARSYGGDQTIRFNGNPDFVLSEY